MPVIYLRSAAIGEGQLEKRLEDARELAQMNGLKVGPDDCIAEHGSGTDISRPGLQRLLRRAERGEISHLVTLRASHLSRDHHDLHQVLITLKNAGVTIVTGHGTNELRAAPD